VICRLLLAVCIAGLLLITARGWTQVDAAGLAVEKTMPLGGSELMEYKEGIERLAVSDPTIVDYVVLNKTQFMLVTKKAGEGDLYVWTKAELQHLHIIVIPPPSRMAEFVESIKQALARPSISVSEHNGVIVLEGEVASADEVKRADTIARAYAPKVENLVHVVNVPVSDWEEPVAAGPPVEKTLTLGGTDTLDFRGIARLSVSDPAMLDCTELSKIQLLLVPKKTGQANLTVWDKLGPHLYHVTIAPPPSRLPELVKQISAGIARPAITVSEHNDMVLLEGEVENDAELKRAEVIARAYVPGVTNLIRVRQVVVPIVDLDEIRRVMGTGIRISRLADGILLFEGVATPEERARLNQILTALGNRIAAIDMVTTSTAPARQVLVRVKAVEINRSALNELGVDWGGIVDGVATDQPIIFGEVADGLIPVDQLGPFRRQGLSARLQALITTNKARILAEPNLLVTEGQLAEILVGGEIPIPVAQTVGTGTGTVSVEWKEFGVRLGIKPIISPDAQSINLDVAPEVSNLDFGNAIVVGGLRLPALQTRRVHSVLTIRDRQTLVIGGLYQTERSKTQRKIPLLGDIPLVGQLFRRTDKQSRDTELVVFVTPEIVTDASSAARTQLELQKMGETSAVTTP